jgi:hypothetical protein
MVPREWGLASRRCTKEGFLAFRTKLCDNLISSAHHSLLAIIIKTYPKISSCSVLSLKTEPEIASTCLVKGAQLSKLTKLTRRNHDWHEQVRNGTKNESTTLAFEFGLTATTISKKRSMSPIYLD